MTQNWDDAEQTDSVTVGELETLAKSLSEKRLEVAEAEAAKTKVNKELAELEGQMQALLNKAGKTSYASNVGTVSISYRENVRLPASLEDKKKFLAYLQSRGVFDEMVSVNYQTLNSYYKTEKAQAEERGDYNFELPGVGAPTKQEILSFRAKKA